MDDGAFARDAPWAPVAAVAVAAPDRVESVAVGRVRVDGTDATREILRLVRATGAGPAVRAVLLDGAVVGGFNVVDLDRLHAELGVPILAVTRRAPDFPAIRAALLKWFPRDAERRWKLLRRHRVLRVPSPGPPVFLGVVGCTRRRASEFLRLSLRRGYRPEAVRLAHLIASASARPGA